MLPLLNPHAKEFVPAFKPTVLPYPSNGNSPKKNPKDSVTEKTDKLVSNPSVFPPIVVDVQAVVKKDFESSIPLSSSQKIPFGSFQKNTLSLEPQSH